MIPVAARNPSVFGDRNGVLPNAIREFLKAVCEPEVHIRKLKAAGEKVNVRVVKTRQDQPAFRIDYTRFTSGCSGKLLIFSNGSDPVREHRDRLGARKRVIHGVYVGVGDEQGCRDCR